jgi:hypothetical protein
MITYKAMQNDLAKALKVGKMSPMLRKAMEETLKAMKAKNTDLAYQITACKSLICQSGHKFVRKYAFHEDRAANDKALGYSLYCMLDGIHFELAMRAHQMPSGMMVLSSTPKGGCVMESMKSSGAHPIVKRIAFEKARTAREAGLRA